MTAPAPFDRHAASYEAQVQRSIAFLGRGHGFFLEAKLDHLLDLVRRRFPRPAELSVLDAGCGTGLLARRVLPHVASVHGIEVSRESARQAAASVKDGRLSCSVYDGRRLPLRCGSFDLVLAACLLHHVLPERRVGLLRGLARALKSGGALAVFEHNPLHPLTHLAVSRCDFDRDARLLGMGEACRLLGRAGLRVVERRSILLLPLRGRLAEVLERPFRRLPLGAQYMVLACPRAPESRTGEA